MLNACSGYRLSSQVACVLPNYNNLWHPTCKRNPMMLQRRSARSSRLVITRPKFFPQKHTHCMHDCSMRLDIFCMMERETMLTNWGSTTSLLRSSGSSWENWYFKNLSESHKQPAGKMSIEVIRGKNWGEQLVKGPVVESVWHQMPRLIPIQTQHSTCSEGKSSWELIPQWFHPPTTFAHWIYGRVICPVEDISLVDCH